MRERIQPDRTLASLASLIRPIEVAAFDVLRFRMKQCEGWRGWKDQLDSVQPSGQLPTDRHSPGTP
jgi:hypothetical protein